MNEPKCPVPRDQQPINEYIGLKEQKSKLRMPIEKEKLLEKKFIQYKKKFCK